MPDQKIVPKDKAPLSLIAWEQLADEARVWQHGIDKGRLPDNWRDAVDFKKYKDALGRHMADFMASSPTDPKTGAVLVSETPDADSGLCLLDHVICNCRILKHLLKKRGELHEEKANR